MPQYSTTGSRSADAAMSCFPRFARAIKRVVAVVGYGVKCWLLSHPGLLKALFEMLRRFRPIAVFGNVVIVAKAVDVREVLDRFSDFHLNAAVAPGMPWGPFLFNIDWRRQHDAERALLAQTVQPAIDIERIRTEAAAVCQRQINRASKTYFGRREIDVVTELFEPVMVNVLAAHLGIQPVDGSEMETARILRVIAAAIMVVPPEGTKRWLQWHACIDKFTVHLERLIGEKAGAAPATSDPGDVLSRLVARAADSANPLAWLDGDWIRRYLTGLAAAGDATVVRASAHALDQLFKHPAALTRGRDLAHRIDAAEAECHRLRAEGAVQALQSSATLRLTELRRRLQQLIYEALRFRPMLPLLVRTSARQTIIAKDTRRARLVPAGATVLIGLLSAMFDPDVFEHPLHFYCCRPLEDFVHFGYGPRECFGKYLADTVMLEIMRALLMLPGLKRAAGTNGRIAYDGPAAACLRVTFESQPINSHRPERLVAS